MQHVSRSKWVLACVIISVVLGTGIILAQDKGMAPAGGGGGVTFVNNSGHDITVFARYGSDESSCEHKPNQIELRVGAKSNSSVDSGTTGVCFCLDVPSRDTCPQGWSMVKPGGKRVFQ
jgi:hypothetical protein